MLKLGLYVPEPDFPALKNDCILRAAWGLRTKRVPVWIMRQAGLYLPKYRELNKKHSFSKIIHTPSLACEATILPILHFDLDAAIIFSDILVIPEALGMEVRLRPELFSTDERNWNVLTDPLHSPQEIQRLMKFNLSTRLRFVYDAIKLTRHKLDGRVPLIGFAGAPWTLMCYMIEGENSKTMSKAKSWLYKWPGDSHILLHVLMDAVVLHLVNQIKAGAQMLQLFEPNAEYLTPFLFEEYSISYCEKIKQLVSIEVERRELEMVPMILYVKGSAMVLDLIGDSNYDILSVDWTVDPSVARSKIPRYISIQGNLDPPVLTADRKKIKELVIKMLKGFGTRGYIANLGDGIYPDIPPENVAYFVETLHFQSEVLIRDD